MDRASDWPEIKQRFQSQWTLSDRDREDVLSWAESVLEHEASRRFFEDFDYVENEAEWVDEAGVIRPDRVVLLEERGTSSTTKQGVTMPIRPRKT